MTKIDLHVHSRYSNHPTEWFLQRLGAAESYTEPEFIFQKVKERGMNFVTITDHNNINGILQLKEKYPDEVITGVEATTYFPEDGCKIHVLIYDFTESQFLEIQKARESIYDLRNYIKEKNLGYSVAHASFSINNRLTVEHLEKILLLFDVFEGINGARNKLNNTTWMDLLKILTPLHTEYFLNKYRIEPMSNDSWIKGFTGGSDDHAGIFIGRTYTVAQGETPHEFIESMKQKKSFAKGRHNNFQSLAFTVYKIAYEFSKMKGDTLPNSLLNLATQKIFEQQKSSFRERFRIKNFFSVNRKRKNSLTDLYFSLYKKLKDEQSNQIEDKIKIVYNEIAVITDELFKALLQSFETDLHKGDIGNVIKNIAASIPGIFLAVPFFTTLFHLYQGRQLLSELSTRLELNQPRRNTKILWFTDSIADLNGVSVTIQNVGWLSYVKEKNLKIVTSLNDEEFTKEIPPNIINLPSIFQFKLPYYEKYLIKVPSILKSLQLIYKYEPDEIYISTPGPIGLFGLMVAKLLNAKCTGIYHTDFALEAKEIAGDDSLVNIIETLAKWFYSFMDEIQVPTREYIDILEERGYQRSKMRLFKRCIDPKLFSPKPSGRDLLKEKYHLDGGIILLYAGRVSKDKNLDFLMEVYSLLHSKKPETNLLIVGDGTYYPELKKKMKQYERVIFTGRLENKNMPEVYSGADLLVFPSITDTFGMVVLEAQSCGLPALVSDRGGPQEIVIPDKTGFIAGIDNPQNWSDRIEYVIDLMEKNPEAYLKMRGEAQRNKSLTLDWEAFLQDILHNQDAQIIAQHEAFVLPDSIPQPVEP